MQITPCHVTKKILHAYYKLWGALMTMFWTRQWKGNPTCYCSDEPDSGEQTWYVWLLSSKDQAGVPGLRSEFYEYSSEEYVWGALDADCGGKKEMFAKQLFKTKNTPPPTTTPIHAAWAQVGGFEHFLKNNDSVCLWSHDLFLLMKTNIILQYDMKKWGKWEGFEKWNTFVNYLILFVWFPRCYQPLLLEA